MSDPVSASMVIFKVSGQVYSIASIKVLVEEIHQNIRAVYSDISNAEYNAAKQAFESSNQSSNFKHELYGAITHLRSAFNIAYELSRATRKKNFLFIPIEDDLLSDLNEKAKVLSSAAHYAAIISWLYSSLSEYSNSKDWEKKAIDTFNMAVEKRDFTYTELKKINKNFVTSGISVKDASDGRHAMLDFDVYKNPTAIGYEYIKKQKEKMLADFKIAISNKQINF